MPFCVTSKLNQIYLICQVIRTPTTLRIKISYLAYRAILLLFYTFGVHKIFDIPVADVYVHYVNKVKRKDRSEDELVEVITWLTGISPEALKNHLEKQTTFREFFKSAKIHPNSKLITGTICGVKIADIEDPLMKKIRYMDKLVDELAKGRAMEKILRT
jgi:hypothetical protein